MDDKQMMRTMLAGHVFAALLRDRIGWPDAELATEAVKGADLLLAVLNPDSPAAEVEAEAAPPPAPADPPPPGIPLVVSEFHRCEAQPDPCPFQGIGDPDTGGSFCSELHLAVPLSIRAEWHRAMKRQRRAAK